MSEQGLTRYAVYLTDQDVLDLNALVTHLTGCMLEDQSQRSGLTILKHVVREIVAKDYVLD